MLLIPVFRGKKGLYHAGPAQSSDTLNANKNPKMAVFIQGKRNMLRSLQKMLSFKCLIINTVSLVCRGVFKPGIFGR